MIVASDLEGTLTTGSTLRGIGRYLVRNGSAFAYRRFAASHLPALAMTRLRLGDAHAFRERVVAEVPRLLRGRTVEQVAEIAEWVVEHELWERRRSAVIAELSAYRAWGYRVILTSATFQPVLEAFARRLGAEALGTTLEIVNGRVTGRIAESVNVGERKDARLLAAVGRRVVHAAYGDTLADLAMLEASSIPVAVEPEAELRHLALARGWRILSTVG